MNHKPNTHTHTRTRMRAYIYIYIYIYIFRSYLIKNIGTAENKFYYKEICVILKVYIFLIWNYFLCILNHYYFTSSLQLGFELRGYLRKKILKYNGSYHQQTQLWIIYIYILSSTDRLLRSIRTHQCG